MKTRKTRRIMLLASSMVLLVCIAVGATIAYLTDSKTVVNTFTVGDVQITLDEEKVTPDGKPLETPRRTTANEENNYHLVPGHEYTKDPTVTVLEGSEPAFVRMLVTINNKSALDEIFAPGGAPLTAIFTGYSDKWELKKQTVVDDTRTYEFRYNQIVDASVSAKKLDSLFTKLTVPGSITDENLEMLEDLEITIVAQAIQADSFTGDNYADKENAAWTAFDA